MPMNRKLYPKNWDAIARKIKEAANWTCQQCGRPCRRPGETLFELEDRIAEHHAEQLAQLREVQREAWRDKDFDLVLKAHDRIARILGTDAPTKQEVAVSSLDPQTVAAAIERVTKIIEKAEAKGAKS